MAFLTTQPYKGTRDFYPDDMRLRNWVFGQMRAVCESYGYREYDGPLLESFDLYAAKSGEELVSQQLYHLIDRGERKVAIRPEMTPTMARMVAQKIHELPRPVRWYSIPNLWRYERPQKGRLREFWQLNVDVLGGDALRADAEILLLSMDLMKKFGGEKFVSIKINNRKLMDQFFSEKLGLTPQATLVVTKAIDARSKIGEEVFKQKLTEAGVAQAQAADLDRFFSLKLSELEKFMPGSGASELVSLFGLLGCDGETGQMVFDPTVMRGLDYYTGTVFEMYDVSPENRRAMFGGGRYDNLLGLFGNHKLPGVGLGMGDVTLEEFLNIHGLLPKFGPAIDVYVSLPDASFQAAASMLAHDLRAGGYRVALAIEVGNFGTQLKQAAKLQARFALLFGESEWEEQKVILKDLVAGTQTVVSPDRLGEMLRAAGCPGA